MHPIYGCLEKFWGVLDSTATFPEILMDLGPKLLFRSMSMNVRIENLKIVGLRVPEIIRGTQKIWAVPGCAHDPFSPKIIKGLLFTWTL